MRFCDLGVDVMHICRRADAALDGGRPHDVGGGVYAVEHLGGLYAHDEGESEEFCDGVYGCAAGVCVSLLI